MRFPARVRPYWISLRFEQLEDRTTPSALRVAPTFSLPGVLTAVPDAVNVVMASTTESAADEAELAAAPFADQVDYLGFGIYRVTLAPGTTTAAADRYYSRRPGVDGAAADTRVHIDQVPNDTSYSSMWGMPQISAPAAWDVATGSRKFAVADIDTGTDYTHPDLANNIWINQKEIPASVRSTLVDTDGDGVITFWDLNAPANAGKVADNDGNGYADAGDILRPLSQGGWQDGADNDGNGYADDLIGWNFVANTNNPFDDHGHGTHTAGTIGAVGDNARGVAGVNWAVSIMSLKFLDGSGNGTTSDAVRALDYAVATGVKVSNNSWGGDEYDPALAAAINRARSAGHIFVAAAGNSGENIDGNPTYPASYSATYNNVVTVAATDWYDVRASFSNFGLGSVTLGAPGAAVLSTTPNNTYSYYSGTSMATPHVAGAIALFWSQHPTWAYTDVIAHLKSSVDAVPALTDDVQTGGRLNVAKFLASAGPTVTGAINPGGSNASLWTIRFAFDRAMDPGTFTAADIGGFTGPGGAISTGYTITPVSGSNNTRFDVSFGTQVAAGTYTMVIGPDIHDTYGDPMNQNGNATNGEVPGDLYTATITLLGGAGPVVTAATWSGSSAANLNTVRFAFDRPIDPGTFTAADVVGFTGPGGAISTGYTITPVSGSNNTQYDVGFATQTAPGAYTMVIGPDIRDTLGSQMNQNGNSVAGEVPADEFTASATLSAVLIIDDGDSGFAAGAGWLNQPSADGYPYYNNNHHYVFGGPGAGAATWTDSGLAAGTYRVSAYWVAYSNRATNASYTIKDGGGNTLATKTINQQLAPGDFQANGYSWADLGTVTLNAAGSLVVSLSGQANQYLIADAVRFELVSPPPPPPPPPPPGTVTVIDDDDARFSAGSGWLNQPSADGYPYYNNDHHYVLGTTGAGASTWTDGGLAAGTYRVSAYWVAYSNRATNASYTIRDGSGNTLATKTINQQAAPGDFQDGGYSWADLGTVTLNAAGNLVVSLSGQANQYLIADAVRFELVSPPPPPPPPGTVTVIDDGDAGYSARGWSEASGGAYAEYYGSDTGYVGGASGAGPATWTATNLAAGTYRVSATYTPFANRATDASYAVKDGTGAVLASRVIDQQQAATDLSYGGSQWDDLGTVTVGANGTLVVSLSGQGNGYLIADAVRFQLM